MRPLRVLDLFAGLEGWSEPFRERDHDVISVDLDPRFDVSLCMDVRDLEPDDLPWTPDVVLASPPCEGFSVMTLGRSWTNPHPGTRYPHLRATTEPKTETARLGVELAERTAYLISVLAPRYFVIENPRAKLRKLPVFAEFERRTVTYCQYGEPFQKPTDLWGGFPPSLVLRPPCKPLSPCHVSAPAGSRTGIQGDGVRRRGTDGNGSPDRAGRLRDGKKAVREHFGTNDEQTLSALRAKVPHALALDVCIAVETDLARGVEAVRRGSLFEEMLG